MITAKEEGGLARDLAATGSIGEREKRNMATSFFQGKAKGGKCWAQNKKKAK